MCFPVWEGVAQDHEGPAAVHEQQQKPLSKRNFLVRSEYLYLAFEFERFLNIDELLCTTHLANPLVALLHNLEKRNTKPNR